MGIHDLFTHLLMMGNWEVPSFLASSHSANRIVPVHLGQVSALGSVERMPTLEAARLVSRAVYPAPCVIPDGFLRG